MACSFTSLWDTCVGYPHMTTCCFHLRWFPLWRSVTDELGHVKHLEQCLTNDQNLINILILFTAFLFSCLLPLPLSLQYVLLSSLNSMLFLLLYSVTLKEAKKGKKINCENIRLEPSQAQIAPLSKLENAPPGG